MQPPISQLTTILSLAVEVPSGQQVYVAKDGALSFREPHSSEFPAGAITKGFRYTDNPDHEVDSWTHRKGLIACPVDGTGYPYQVFVKVDGFNGDMDNCIGLGGGATPYRKGFGAFQYD